VLWSFAKYVGCGNDFIIFDNREGHFPVSDKHQISHLCHRQCGIGADGIILLEASQKGDFRMRIFNADSSEAEMCGNGIRCLVKYCHQLFPLKQQYIIETMHRLHKASIEGEDVCIDMGSPTHMQWNVPLFFQQQEILFQFLDTGVPHAVFFDPDIDSIDLKQLGPYIRHHPNWGLKGTNVTLAQNLDNTHFKMRTFERGVEGETLGCGTGATAVALAAAKQYPIKSPVTIHMKAGDVKIGFENQDDRFSNITMTGPASCTYEGKVKIRAKE
jgi:diaminopimelate epimerase